MLEYINSHEQACYKSYMSNGPVIQRNYENTIAKFEQLVSDERILEKSLSYLKELERDIVREMNELKAKVMDDRSLLFVKNTYRNQKFQLGQLIYIDYYFTEEEIDHIE